MKHTRTAKAIHGGYIRVADGIERKTLVFGEKTLMTEFRLGKGSRLPFHQHPYEQTGYLVSGRLSLVIEGQRYEMTPGAVGRFREILNTVRRLWKIQSQ
jgi:quercetin dioxygenase-like cupin family protein